MSIPKNYYSNVDVKKLGIEDISSLSTKVASLDEELNDETDGVVKRVSDLEDYQPVKIAFTLPAGNTSVTIESRALKEDSLIYIFTDTFGINPTNMEIVSGDLVITFDEQSADLTGYIMIYD